MDDSLGVGKGVAIGEIPEARNRVPYRRSGQCTTSRSVCPGIGQRMRIFAHKAVCRLSLLLLAAAAVRAQGADLYVSTQGLDSNSGTLALPLRTITRAYSLAAPGVTIVVMP